MSIFFRPDYRTRKRSNCGSAAIMPEHPDFVLILFTMPIFLAKYRVQQISAKSLVDKNICFKFSFFVFRSIWARTDLMGFLFANHGRALEILAEGHWAVGADGQNYRFNRVYVHCQRWQERQGCNFCCTHAKCRLWSSCYFFKFWIFQGSWWAAASLWTIP